MHQFETLSDFLTFADTYDCIIFEKYDVNKYGEVFGVYEDEIYEQNETMNAAYNRIMNSKLDISKYDIRNFDQDKFFKDLEEAERSKDLFPEEYSEDTPYSVEYFNYKTWSEWAGDNVNGLERACVVMNSKKNQNSRFIKLLAKAKKYLDKDKFNFNKDNIFIDWRYYHV